MRTASHFRVDMSTLLAVSSIYLIDDETAARVRTKTERADIVAHDLVVADELSMVNCRGNTRPPC